MCSIGCVSLENFNTVNKWDIGEVNGPEELTISQDKSPLCSGCEVNSNLSYELFFPVWWHYRERAHDNYVPLKEFLFSKGTAAKVLLCPSRQTGGVKSEWPWLSACFCSSRYSAYHGGILWDFFLDPNTCYLEMLTEPNKVLFWRGTCVLTLLLLV
jgi:hypothetical protein